MGRACITYRRDRLALAASMALLAATVGCHQGGLIGELTRDCGRPVCEPSQPGCDDEEACDEPSSALDGTRSDARVEPSRDTSVDDAFSDDANDNTAELDASQLPETFDAGSQPGPWEADAGGSGDAGESVPLSWSELHYAAPRVVYENERQVIRLFGSGLRPKLSATLYLDGAALGTWVSLSDREGSIELPELPAGEHFLQVDAPSSPQHPGARVFVTTHARYEEAELRLPGYPRALVFDAERGAFFAALLPFNTLTGRLARVRYDAGQWTLTEAAVPGVSSVALSADGRELLATNGSCVMLHLDPVSLELRKTQELRSNGCGIFPSDTVYAFADGQVIYGHTREWPYLWEYPSLREVTVPSVNYATQLISAYQTALLFGSNTNAVSGYPLYRYDVSKHAFLGLRTLGTDYYTDGMLSMSGDAERTLHGPDVYDASFRFLGSLANVVQPRATGVSTNGKVAAAYDPVSTSLRAYDISGNQGPFPALANAVPIGAASFGEPGRLILNETGEVAFAFTQRWPPQGSSDPEHYFVVRKLRPAPSGTSP